MTISNINSLNGDFRQLTPYAPTEIEDQTGKRNLSSLAVLETVPTLKAIGMNQLFVYPEIIAEGRITDDLLEEIGLHISKNHGAKLFDQNSDLNDEQYLYLLKLFAPRFLASKEDALSKRMITSLQKGHIQTALFLIKYVNIHKRIYVEAFQYAKKTKNDAFILELLKRELIEEDLLSSVLLYIAARTNNSELLELSLTTKPIIEGLDIDGKTPLSQILSSNEMYEKHKDLIQTLIAAGASITSQDKTGKTPLMDAIENKRIDEAKLLIEKTDPKDLDIKDEKGNTALTYAIETDQKDFAKLLINREANINISNKISETPLTFAVEKDVNKFKSGFPKQGYVKLLERDKEIKEGEIEIPLDMTLIFSSKTYDKPVLRNLKTFYDAPTLENLNI